MAYVRNLCMPSLLSNKVNLGWNIVLAKLVETVVKELLLINIRIQMSVGSTISATSVVSKPDVKTCISKLESN